MGMSEIRSDRESFAFSAENPKGEPNGGTRGKDCDKLNAFIRIAPHTTATLLETEGEGMITHMWIGSGIRHELILRCYWDHLDLPSVEAPLSAFFGVAYDENFTDDDGKYMVLNSAAILVAPTRGCNAYFEMPFRDGALITLENRSDEEKTVYYMISGYHGKPDESAGYFHAQYMQEHPVTKGRAYTVLDNVRGEGRFLGVTFAAGLNGNSSCWVEGETKMYIDGDIYPTLNFTGTEDYFCGSFAFGNDWSEERYQQFSGLYCGMFAKTGGRGERYNTQQRFLLYRFHVADPIYFHESFRMTFDSLGWTGPRYDDYTTVAYYYLDRPQALAYALPEEKEMVMK